MKTNLTKLLLVFLLNIFALNNLNQSYALPSKSNDPQKGMKVFIGLGTIDQHINKYGVDNYGKSSLTPRTFSNLSLSAHLNLFKFRLAPEIDYTALGITNADSQKFKMLIVGLPFLFTNVSKWFDLKAGPAMIWNYTGTTASSSTKEMPNGNSTITFYLPTQTLSTRILALELGIGTSWRFLRADLNCFIEDLVSTKRSITLGLNISYWLF